MDVDPIEDRRIVALSVLGARATARESVESIFDIAKADGVALYWWDDGQRVLIPLAHAGSLLKEKGLPVVHPGQGLIGSALRDRRPILLEDEYAASPYMTAWVDDYGIRSEYAVPILFRKRALGVLSVMYGHERKIDLLIRRAIELAAKLIVPTLGVARLLAQAEHSVSESMTLAKLLADTATRADVHATCARITETACRLTGADYAFIDVLEEGGAVCRYGAWGVRASEGKADVRGHLIAGVPGPDQERTQVFTRLPERPDANRAEFSDSVAQKARVIIVTPLGEAARRLGSLVVGWRVDIEPTLRQIALAETLGRRASTILTQARAIERIAALEYGSYAAADLAVVVDASLLIRYASPSYRSVLGWEPAEMIGRRFFDFVVPDDVAKAEQHVMLSRLENSGRIEPFYYRVRHGDGSTRVLESRGVNRSDDPVIDGWLLYAQDITSLPLRRFLGNGRLVDRSLSKLLDREAIDEVLHFAAADAHAQRSSLALILVDLDRFGAVVGDMRSEVAEGLLREAGDRLRSVLHGGDRIGRLGSDEFLIIASHADEAAAQERVDKLLHIMEAPFHVDGDEQRFPVSVGVALYPAHGLDARTLLRHVGIAAHAAKRSRCGGMFYDEESDRSAEARVAAVSALREAIAHGDLRLHYQPIFDVRTMQVVQAEALCRWPTAPIGLGTPDAFIPLAEHAGLIGSLTQWVIRNAVEQWAHWRDIAPSSLSINISMEDLSDPDLADRFERIFAETRVEPSRICLELTESALLLDVERSVRTLERLVALGVSFSIDDFGTGYTSLAYLKRFPVHELKIDRSFVTNVERDQHDRTIVRSIIDLAHGLGLGVVAEGVESVGALDLLREWGCDRAQGHILAMPMPPEEFAERFFQSSLT
jgi:diguanylate cyclase (GGDEF)-like protein/PAS domain S-box-containing protein